MIKRYEVNDVVVETCIDDYTFRVETKRHQKVYDDTDRVKIGTYCPYRVIVDHGDWFEEVPVELTIVPDFTFLEDRTKYMKDGLVDAGWLVSMKYNGRQIYMPMEMLVKVVSIDNIPKWMGGASK